MVGTSSVYLCYEECGTYALTRVPVLRNLVEARLLDVRMHHQDGSESKNSRSLTPNAINPNKDKV